MSPNDTYQPSRLSARCIFLTVTLAMTATASGFMVLSLMTDYWEYISFDRGRVTVIADNNTKVEWLMDNQVARLHFLPVKPRPTPSAVMKLFSGPLMNKKKKKMATDSKQNSTSLNRRKRDIRTVYLVPMYGGVWRICTNLNENQRRELAHWGYSHAWCKQYLSPDYVSEGPNDWMTRMQNLSISCAMVCLILLASSALLGLFGIFKRQISAVLITGVMYILAAVFCVFTLSIMHFKRKTSKDCGLVDPMVPEKYQHAQITSMGWSLAIGWVSICFCLFTAFLWYLLSKIMRYGPITLT